MILPERQRRGALAHAAGMAAEESVARHYEERGLAVAARRWRSPGGEVDLILRDGERVVFVEVKRAARLDDAALRLLPRQAARLMAAAQLFCATEPQGLLTDMRLDLALVNAAGRVRVIENAVAEGW
jgi:putative endonuclease